MSRRPFNQRDATLMQIAAAVVGSVGATQLIRPPAEQAPMCRDPHCPSVGVPHFGPAICPPEHAEAWRYEFKQDER